MFDATDEVMNKTLHILYERLTNSCVEYIAHSPIGESRAIVEFAGQFEGRPVLWQAMIIALETEASNIANQYISVNAENDEAPQVEIGLPLSLIDEPTVLKAITMIRQYKNLHRGRYEFQGIQKQK